MKVYIEYKNKGYREHKNEGYTFIVEWRRIQTTRMNVFRIRKRCTLNGNEYRILEWGCV